MASKKERVWLNEYLKCWNATEAARRAGYKWPNKVAGMKLKKFEAEISERLQEKVMGADEALMRLSEIARGEYSKYINSEGYVDLEKMIDDGKAHLINKIYETKYGLRVEFYDMQSALVNIGKAHGAFKDVQEITGSGRLTVEYVNNWRNPED